MRAIYGAMMSGELKQQVLDYLHSHNTMTLATCAGDIPWGATVFYASDDLQLYFFSSPEARHSLNLSANSRVAVTIQEDYKDWRAIKGIQLEGTVMLVDGVIEKAKAMAVYARKYADVIKLFTDPSSGIFHKAYLKVKFYRVVPERVFFLDNEQGFGKRQELDLNDR
ncbi:MAG: pyridoxamine 5'-phosphate oxidase family protein [Candidatus Binatia bacterium]